MAGKTNDPKETRITVRLQTALHRRLHQQSRRLGCTMGEAIRRTLAEHLPVEDVPAVSSKDDN